MSTTQFFRYFEQARVEWFREADCGWNADKEGPVIVNAHCTFLKQLKYPGDIEVRTFAGAPGRSSFDTYQEVRRIDEPDVLVAEGGAKVVWVNFVSEKSVALPARVVGILPPLARPEKAEVSR